MLLQVDVIVVGAGPAGLLLAIELAVAGVKAVVLERLAEPSLVDRALMIGPLGIEALQRRGMGAAIAAAEQRVLAAMAGSAAPASAGAAPAPRYNGHFAGLALIRPAAQKQPERRGRPVDQQSAEAMLADTAQALGVEVRRGCQVHTLMQHDDGVEVAWSAAAGEGRLRCAYLVGCDGGRSSVRKMAGFAFPGTPPTLTMYQADVEIDHPERLLPKGWRRGPGGVFSFGFMPGRLIMLDFSGPPAEREAPVAREEVEQVLRVVSGIDVRVTALAGARRWTDNTRLADTYRRGRVLLAGDAAHIHTPFGGQGMNLGLADAANLGWKLAAVLRSGMPDSLLDTYGAERRPVAEAVLANTLAQAAIMRPDPQSGALRELVAKLMEFDDVNRYFGAMMSGLSTRYDLGAADDQVGRLSGDLMLVQGDGAVSLYQLMQHGGAVFLDASSDGAAGRLVAATVPALRCVSVAHGCSMLIRPDACIAWAGAPDSTEGLPVALRRWFAPHAGG